MTAVGPAQQPVTTAVAGAFIVVCAASAAFAVAVSDRLLSPDVPGSRLDYPPAVGPLPLTLALLCTMFVVATHLLAYHSPPPVGD